MEDNTKSRQLFLVTGGAGFVGSCFVKLAVNAGHRVVTLDKLTYAGNLNNLAAVQESPLHSFIKGDIADSTCVRNLLLRYRPVAVVNFAAESHVDRSIQEAEDCVQTNVVGTFRLLDEVRSYVRCMTGGAQARFRFLHVSTDEVYGSLSPSAAPFSEEHGYEPNNPYAATKAAGEHLVRAYHRTYGVPTLTTNCSNNYGPHQHAEKFIPLVISKALAGQALPIYGDGQQIRDWLYVEDHCKAIYRVLAAGRLGEKYNIGGSSEITNITLVYLLCERLDQLCPRADGKSYKEQLVFVADRPGHDRRYALNTQKIRSELGWHAQESFQSGIEKTVKWYVDLDMGSIDATADESKA